MALHHVSRLRTFHGRFYKDHHHNTTFVPTDVWKEARGVVLGNIQHTGCSFSIDVVLRIEGDRHTTQVVFHLLITMSSFCMGMFGLFRDTLRIFESILDNVGGVSPLYLLRENKRQNNTIHYNFINFPTLFEY